MDSAQITGAASSYARKYALNGLFLIDDTKDPDTQKPPKTELPKTDHITKLKTKLNELGAKTQEEAEKLIKEKTGEDTKLDTITQSFAQSLLIKILENGNG